VKKDAKVYTNDPRNRIETLNLEADIQVPIFISTKDVYFTGVAGTPIKRIIKIRAEKDKPLTLDQDVFDLGDKVSYRIEELEPGRVFLLHFTNISRLPEPYRGVLKLKTNYAEKPEINIRIRGSFQKSAKD
jgi:hypothetical protein